MEQEAFILSNGTVDYYAVLQIDDDATSADIKAAYRSLAKVCHPDFLGDAGHNICILLNEAYEVLTNPVARRAYDAQLEVALQDQNDGYTGKPLSKWIPDIKPEKAKNEDPNEDRAVFVDELSCIGCKNCVWLASAMFRIEPEYGRARVFAQWLNTEDKIQESIDSCPVSCIHWVDRADLPALEYVCQKKTSRVNVGMMMAGQGAATDVFGAAKKFLKDRRALEEQRRKAAMKASPLQEEARRKAAAEMAQQRAGWLGELGFNFAQAMRDAANGTGARSNGNGDQSPRVGQRKRPVRHNGAAGESYDGDAAQTLIPLELSLVPYESVDEY